ncbi:hydrogenase maturation nickel metallochaperone HypA [Methylovulum miyakonense]
MTNLPGADLHLPEGCMAGIAMHELSLCESILQVLEQQAQTQQYRKVKTVWLEIGVLAGVEVEALRFSFDVVTQGSLAEQAKLEIIDMPGQAWCMPCGRNVAVQQLYDLCPHCGSHQLQVNSGDQMRIKELEVE